MKDWFLEQEKLCRDYGVEPYQINYDEKVGVSYNIRSGLIPINGVRCLPEKGTTGWYIWAGEEMSSDENFFVSLHARHLEEWCPSVIRFLQLPPGWRFLIAGDYVDVWYDANVDLSPVGD